MDGRWGTGIYTPMPRPFSRILQTSKELTEYTGTRGKTSYRRGEGVIYTAVYNAGVDRRDTASRLRKTNVGFDMPRRSLSAFSVEESLFDFEVCVLLTTRLESRREG